MAAIESSATNGHPDKPKKSTPKHVEPTIREPRNFLVAFLLTMVVGPLGLRHFYLGNKKLGWIRTGLFAGGYIWLLVTGMLGMPVMAIFGFFAIMTASVWAVVDFFYVYNAVKTDADGQPLTATSRDRKWAKIFYIAAIIGFIAGVAIGIVGATLIENEIKKGTWDTTNSSNTESGPLPGESLQDYMRRQMQDNQQTY